MTHVYEMLHKKERQVHTSLLLNRSLICAQILPRGDILQQTNFNTTFGCITWPFCTDKSQMCIVFQNATQQI